MGTGGEGDDSLHKAARSGDLTTVQSILNSNPLSINSRDKHSRTPLHLAAWAGHAQVVSYLCKQKADVGAAAMDDMGAIHFAAQKGHLEVVRTLLSFGASLKASTRKGLTAVHYAAQGSHLELVKYLVKKGASPSIKTKAGKIPRDLASGKEIRLFLKDCEQSPMKECFNAKEKAEASDSKLLVQDKSEKSGIVEHDVEQEDERFKRKREEDDIREASSEPKKARVALNRLLSSDDTEQDDNI